MDLVRHDDEASATEDLIACQSLEFDDFFVFAIEKLGRITEELDGGAVRYRVRAELAGRPFETVTVDIGFSDALGWKPEQIQGPDLLSFAGIDPVDVPILPLEQHVAEKVHAYSRTYGDGRQSSRVKDLVDLVLIKQTMTLDGARLRAALVGVFESRGQQPLPDALPTPPRDWNVAFRKLADEVGIDPDIETGHTGPRDSSIPCWADVTAAPGMQHPISDRHTDTAPDCKDGLAGIHRLLEGTGDVRGGSRGCERSSGCSGREP